MSRLEIEKHERSCPSAFVGCPHSSACGSIRRGQLESHLAECVYKPVSCMYCGSEMMRRLLESHFVDCPDLPLTCHHCSQSVAQKRMRRHLDRKCEGKLHRCPYESHGCVENGDMSAKDLQLHMHDSASDHLELVQQQTSLSMKLMENKFTKMLAIKDAEIEELKRASRNRYRFSWDVPWKHIAGDTTIRAYTSQKFDIFGRKFYLALWPIGEPIEHEARFSDVSREETAPTITSYAGDTTQPISIAQNTYNPHGSSASSHSNVSSSYGSSSSSSVPTSPSSSFLSLHMQQQQQQQQQLQQQQQQQLQMRSDSYVGAVNSATPTSATAVPPALGTSPKSLSSQLLDRLKSFVRPRASSQEALQLPLSQQQQQPGAGGGRAGAGGATTYVAVYLMMEDEQPAPPSTAAAPRIYSPISGLVPQSPTTSSSSYALYSATTTNNNNNNSAGLRAENPFRAHDPFRSMNVNLMRHQPHFASSSSSTSSSNVGLNSESSSTTSSTLSLMQQQMTLPMRPPESMVVEYTLRLVNSSPLLAKSSYFEATFPLANGNGWGEEAFIETSQISQASGFLDRNNVLHVQCDIQVRQCTFDV